jgi:hypothetical protein
MRRRAARCRWRAAVLLGMVALPALAAEDPLGIEALRRELGEVVIDGRDVVVAQVEPPSRLPGEEKGSSRRSHAPDRTLDEFAGVRFHNARAGMLWGSSHATLTGRLLYGRTGSLAPGIDDVWLYTANDFLQRLMRPQSLAKARVWSHSWVGATKTNDGVLLRALDKSAQRYEWLIAVGLANRGDNLPLLASAFNVLSVGRSDGGHAQGAARVDRRYSGKRGRPHLVVPAGKTSEAVPVAASAAALLIQAARELGKGAPYVVTVDGRRVVNGARAITLRAALMAGASREFDRGSVSSALVQPGYRADPSVRTDNGLDTRFGAGQLNVYNSYRIIAGGETDSAQDDPQAPPLTAAGFDLDPHFGGARDSNARGLYRIHPPGDAQLVVALIWPLRREGVTRVDDLNLVLYDATQEPVVVASSDGRHDTGEHVVAELDGSRNYQLVVTKRGREPVDVPYALAWRMIEKQGAARGARPPR